MNAAKLVVTASIGKATATATEIWIQRSNIGFLLMAIASAGICLPDFDQRVGHTLPRLVANLPIHQDARPDSAGAFSGIILQQVAVLRTEDGMTKYGAAFLAQSSGKR